MVESLGSEARIGLPPTGAVSEQDQLQSLWTIEQALGVVGDVSGPPINAAIELAIAAIKGVPTLSLYDNQGSSSWHRGLKDMRHVGGGDFTVASYDDTSEALDQLRAFVSNLGRNALGSN